MAGSIRGQRFSVSTFGESHGGGVGVVVDGCPSGHPFPLARIQAQLARRRPGASRLTSQRKEADLVEVLSGVDPISGRTLGTPIAMVVRNQDARSEHYDDIARVLRPSHADFTLDAKFGLRAVAGGGRSSARETIGRVAAGALAEDLLHTLFGTEIIAWVDAVGDVDASGIDEATLRRGEVDANDVRCPDPASAAAMEARILDARKQGDSVGGVVRCVVRGLPRGLGEPVFSKLTAELSSALMSLPASRAFEIGEGFAAARLRGSTHNDAFVPSPSGIRTATNRSGGVQGGISTGEPLRLAVAFKPVATIFQPQDTVTREGEAVRFSPSKGRHDPCVVPRAVPMVEAMVALTLIDAVLLDATSRIDRLRAAFDTVPARFVPEWAAPPADESTGEGDARRHDEANEES